MIILALGTNIEPREQYLKNALARIEENNLKIILESSVYETPAWGGVADQNFLNMCIEVETSLGAYELLDTIQKIELELGRVRKEHWGNRTIDIDIITFDDLVFNDDRLIVPHKYIHDRNFVLAPLVEMYGSIEIAGKNIKESLEKITEPISVYKEKL
jgi:2-amino-4-hydroxy-6-hydroxymethyldihydropteridine diphosphokinase